MAGMADNDEPGAGTAGTQEREAPQGELAPVVSPSRHAASSFARRMVASAQTIARREWNTAQRLIAPLAALWLLTSTTRGASTVNPIAPSSAARQAPPALAASALPSSLARSDVRQHSQISRPTRRARIIVNPTSGGGRGAALIRDGAAFTSWLAERGLIAEICPTTGPDSARLLAEQAVRAGMEVVVAAGGDGTINEVLQALVSHTTSLGVLPLGTVNVWAREMNIPLGLADARRVLVEGVRRRIDVGRANTRYFLLMAGIGIDAEVTRRVERHWLKRAGLKLLDYIATSGYVGITQRPLHFTIRRGTRRRSAHAVQILIGNTRLWGGAIELAQRALADDGWLDVVYVGGHHLRHRVNVVIRAALRRRGLGPGTRYERVRTLHLEAGAPLPVQVDGELIGHLPMDFAIMPRMLTVIVPRSAPTDLFVHPPLED